MSDTPNPIGRPTKMTDEVVNKLENAFKDGANVTEACRIAEISTRSYYEWLNTNEDFSHKMTNAQEYPDVIAKMVLVKAIKSDDVDTAKWWAERRMKNEFSTKQELAGNLGITHYGWQDSDNTVQSDATPENPAQFKE